MQETALLSKDYSTSIRNNSWQFFEYEDDELG